MKLSCLLYRQIPAVNWSEDFAGGSNVTVKRKMALAFSEKTELGSCLRAGSRALRLMLHLMPSCRLSMRS